MRLRKYRWIFLGTILAFQILFVLFWQIKRQAFFVDEIWSYGLANSNYHPFLYSDGALEHGCTSAVVLYCSSYDLFMLFRKF